MFNNRLFKTARTEDENYFYESLRDDRNTDPSDFLHRYYDYITRNFDLDENQKDIAMTFATEMVVKPELMNILDTLISQYEIDKLSPFQLGNLYNNFDDAFFDYAMPRITSFYWYKLPTNSKYSSFNEFLKEPSLSEKKSFFNQHKNVFVINNRAAEPLEKELRYIIELVDKIVKIQNGNLVLSLELINFYSSPLAHVMPLVPTSYGDITKIRKKDACISVSKIVSDFIKEDMENRSDILNSLVSIGAFYDLVTEKYPDLYNRLDKINIRLNRYDNQFMMVDIRRLIKNNLSSSVSKTKGFPSKHFDEFNLSYASNEEREIFNDLEKLGLYAIPAKQSGIINLLDDEGQKFGFRIDFLLPCNVREYDGENYTLRSDIIFVGEYFGYYGSDYEARKKRKILWQNNLENALEQRCLHIEPDSDLCTVLRQKNIDSKCYSDFGGELFSVKSDNEKKTYYVKSQIQHFLYQYLVNELLWEINYDYSLNTTDNYNRVKENNGVYLDRFEKLLLDVEKYSPKYLVTECAKIVDDYKKNFDKKRKIKQRLSFVYNHSKSPSN